MINKSIRKRGEGIITRQASGSKKWGQVGGCKEQELDLRVALKYKENRSVTEFKNRKGSFSNSHMEANQHSAVVNVLNINGSHARCQVI